MAIFEELGDPQADGLRARLRPFGHTKCHLAVQLDGRIISADPAH
jgi:hypothetical protein